jgi:hypothetical protein
LILRNTNGVSTILKIIDCYTFRIIDVRDEAAFLVP